MPEIACIKYYPANPPRLTGQPTASFIKRHRLHWHTKIIYSKRPEHLPLAHNPHLLQPTQKQFTVNTRPIRPQQPAPVADLPQAHASHKEMLQEVREHDNHIIIRRGQRHIRTVVLPYPHATASENVALHPLHTCVDTLRNLRRHQAVQFHQPRVDGHRQVLLALFLRLHLNCQWRQKRLRLLVVLRIEEKDHVTTRASQRTLVALRPPDRENHVVVVLLRYSLTVYTRVYLPLADYILLHR